MSISTVHIRVTDAIMRLHTVPKRGVHMLRLIGTHEGTTSMCPIIVKGGVVAMAAKTLEA
jgi:hypothetical protein